MIVMSPAEKAGYLQNLNLNKSLASLPRSSYHTIFFCNFFLELKNTRNICSFNSHVRLINTFSSATSKGYLVKFLEKICRMFMEKLNKCKMILLFKYC